MIHGNRKVSLATALVFGFATWSSVCGQPRREQQVAVQWNNVLRVSNTNATLQAVVTPLMSPDSALHEKVWAALSDLHANYVRYVPWLPYPRLAVAELQPPTDHETFWNFSRIDPYTLAFFKANPQQSAIINFSTIPQWMF
jgi:hypothetical protein